MYNKKDKLIWVFKRVVNSELDKHLIFKVVYAYNKDQLRRGGWHHYTSPDDIEAYYIKYKDKWDNPWVK
tara:strand:+ start:1292 stop:1498 length:207 start_codon:yes stop_codon:yes gene_type:complete